MFTIKKMKPNGKLRHRIHKDGSSNRKRAEFNRLLHRKVWTEIKIAFQAP